MDLADQFVRSRGDHCKCAYPFTGSWVSPVFPNATNPEGFSIFHRNREGLLCFGAFDGHPLVEAVHGKDAATRSISVAKVGSVCTVSHLALMGLRPPCGSLHQFGIRPQRSGSSETSPIL